MEKPNRWLCATLFSVVLLFAGAAFPAPLYGQDASAQDAPEPEPEDPAVAKAWRAAAAARTSFEEAEQEHRAAQEAVAQSPDSSDARAAEKKARQKMEKARRRMVKAERLYRAKEAAWRRRKAPPMDDKGPRDDSAPPRRRPRATEGEGGPPPGVPPGGATPTPKPPSSPLTGETPAPSPTPTPTASPTPAAAAPVPAPAPSPFEGSYSGDWVNKTFGSRGSAAAVITVDATTRTFQCVLTLGGLVFGVGTPPPQTFTGSYTDAGRKITTNSPLLGNVSLSVSPAGAITGSATGLPNPNIRRVDFKGSATPQRIQVNYTVVFSGGGGTAQGVMTLNR